MSTQPNRKLSILRHKKRFHLHHRGKNQFLSDTDLSQILGISERTARGYIKDPSKIPQVATDYMRIVCLGHIPGCDEIQLDVENPGTFVTSTNLRFNQEHLMGYLWQMQAFKTTQKQVYRLEAEIAELKSNRIALPKKAKLVLVRTPSIEPAIVQKIYEPRPHVKLYWGGKHGSTLVDGPKLAPKRAPKRVSIGGVSWGKVEIDLPFSEPYIVQAVAADFSIKQPLIAG